MHWQQALLTHSGTFADQAEAKQFSKRFSLLISENTKTGMNVERPPLETGISSSTTCSHTTTNTAFSSPSSANVTPATSVGSWPDSPSSPHMSSALFDPAVHQQQDRAFSTWILGLLNAVEGDTSNAAHGLEAYTAPLAFAASPTPSERPPETEAIQQAISRIATRLAKAETAVNSQQKTLSPNIASDIGSTVFLPPNVSELMGVKKNRPSIDVTSDPISSSDGSTPPNINTPIRRMVTAEDELSQLQTQVQDFARVCKAVALGDLTQRVEVNVSSADLVELKDVINGMVSNLSVFAHEVSRVSREVGTEGFVFLLFLRLYCRRQLLK